MHYLINGMTLRRDTNWQLNVPIMAFADVELPEISATIKGVMLGYRDGKFVACAPTKKENERGVHWSLTTEWAQRLGADLYDLYRRMGGEKPPGRADGKPRVNTLRREIKPVAVPVKSVDEIDATLQRLDDHLADHGGTLSDALAAVSDAPDISEMGLSRPETAGLARVLGVAQ